MSDTQIKTRRMGQERWKYLDMANMSFANGAWGQTEGYIRAFLSTVKDGTDASKEITEEFDRVEADKQAKIKQIQEESKELGYLEQSDYITNGMQQLLVGALYDQKTICWALAMKYGLFNE